MARFVQKLRGTTAELNGIVGADGLLTFDQTLNDLRVYDGVTAGGYRIPNLPFISDNFVSNAGDTIDGQLNVAGKIKKSAAADPGDADAANDILNRGELIAMFIDLFYPVGSTIITESATNPGTRLPDTTWTLKSEGRAIVGVGNGRTVGEQFGSDIINLTSSQLPSHSHSGTSLSVSSAGEHFHGVGTYAIAVDGSHTHSNGTYATDTDTHSHSGTTGNDTHSHGYVDATPDRANPSTGTVAELGQTGNYSILDVNKQTAQDTHNHTFSTNSDSHSHDVTGESSPAGAHSHNLSGFSNTVSAHTHNISGVTGTIGSGADVFVTQASMAFYIWVRTA